MLWNKLLAIFLVYFQIEIIYQVHENKMKKIHALKLLLMGSIM